MRQYIKLTLTAAVILSPSVSPGHTPSMTIPQNLSSDSLSTSVPVPPPPQLLLAMVCDSLIVNNCDLLLLFSSTTACGSPPVWSNGCWNLTCEVDTLLHGAPSPPWTNMKLSTAQAAWWARGEGTSPLHDTFDQDPLSTFRDNRVLVLCYDILNEHS